MDRITKISQDKNLLENLIRDACLKVKNRDHEIHKHIGTIQRCLGDFAEALIKAIPREQKELMQFLVKEVVYDGLGSRIMMKLGIEPLQGPDLGGNSSMSVAEWLPGLDSNQEYRLQRAMCYRYTTRE